MPATEPEIVQTDKPAAHTGRREYFEERQHLRGSVNEAAEKFAHYPPAIREDALWLRLFCQGRCNGEHAVLGKIARALGLRDASGKEPSDQYWYQVTTGRYFKPSGDVKAFARYVSAFRGYAQQQEVSGAIPHVETTNWHLIRDYIDSRRTFSSSCRVGGIEGLTGAQKTHCLKHYATLNNHRETVHIEAPARSTRPRLVQKLAEIYEVAMGLSIGEKEVEIERFLRSAASMDPERAQERRPRTIIIDNVQRLFRPGVPPDQQPIFNYFHELQDDTGFCLILSWVPSFTKTILSDHPFWAQFVGRIGGPDEILRLEQKLDKKDLLAFARAFRVEDDARALPILRKWSGSTWGVRVLMVKLEKARRLATARRSKEIAVDHLEQVDLEAVSAADLAAKGGDAS